MQNIISKKLKGNPQFAKVVEKLKLCIELSSYVVLFLVIIIVLKIFCIKKTHERKNILKS